MVTLEQSGHHRAPCGDAEACSLASGDEPATLSGTPPPSSRSCYVPCHMDDRIGNLTAFDLSLQQLDCLIDGAENGAVIGINGFDANGVADGEKGCTGFADPGFFRRARLGDTTEPDAIMADGQDVVMGIGNCA